ncbi:MAG: alpha/beta hydrolase family protein [Candidatus Coproplasma sp.]
MEWYNVLMLCVAGLAILVCLLALFIVPAFVVYRAVFGERQDKNKNLKYFTPEEFNLDYEEVQINYRKIKLYGAVYHKKPLEECEKLIIFAHGMGAGHCAYTTEINYLAEQGYAVLSYDNYGCDRSEGKNAIGFYAGAEAVIAAYIAAKSDEKLKNMPVWLVGHSWGGYSVLCASSKINVKGVVAFSAFSSPTKIFGDLVKAYSNGFFAGIAKTGVWFINLFKFGVKGNTNAVKAVERSNTPALLIWGEKDNLVTRRTSAACLAKGKNITALIEKDKKHNPYNTVAAEEKLAELGADKSELSDKERGDFYENFDYTAATEEDEKVMSVAVEFIERTT